jgi:hypothetical protein
MTSHHRGDKQKGSPANRPFPPREMRAAISAHFCEYPLSNQFMHRLPRNLATEFLFPVEPARL